MNALIPVKNTRRSYTDVFKAELVKACQQPGVSLAGLALQHGLNANLLQRWVREHDATPTGTLMPFVPMSLPASAHPQSCQLQMQGNNIQVTLSVPVHQLEQCAGLLLRLLR